MGLACCPFARERENWNLHLKDLPVVLLPSLQEREGQKRAEHKNRETTKTQEKEEAGTLFCCCCPKTTL
jgi:hypothetical protein